MKRTLRILGAGLLNGALVILLVALLYDFSGANYFPQRSRGYVSGFLFAAFFIQICMLCVNATYIQKQNWKTVGVYLLGFLLLSLLFLISLFALFLSQGLIGNYTEGF